MNMFNKILLVATIAFATAPAFSQGVTPPTYAAPAISLPATTIAATISTNLASGWSVTNITYSTNTLYVASSASFVSTIVTNTAISTAYANFDAQSQRNVALQFEFAMNGATTTNVDITVARSVTGVSYDTVNNQTFSFAANGSTAVVGVTNIDMYGFGYGRVVTVFNRDSTRNLTNFHAYASKSKFANK